jgi:hypothetical protein
LIRECTYLCYGFVFDKNRSQLTIQFEENFFFSCLVSQLRNREGFDVKDLSFFQNNLQIKISVRYYSSLPGHRNTDLKLISDFGSFQEDSRAQQINRTISISEVDEVIADFRIES